jgi:prepilin-type N-terminal cleavage/methylation domain-containing protein
MTLPLSNRTRQTGFTLVELLVVIGVIGVLIGILVPTLSYARNRAARTTCSAQLRDIGAMFNMYLNEHKGRVPRINPYKKTQPNLVLGAPSFVEVLSAYHKGATKVFRCPSDQILNRPQPDTLPPDVTTWFEANESSYMYNIAFNALFVPMDDDGRNVGKVFRDAVNDMIKGREERFGVKMTINEIDLAQDCEPFHNVKKPREADAVNVLFADFHVGPRPEWWLNRRRN